MSKVPPYESAEPWVEWQKVLMTLPDEGLFRLAENYMGELKSPFHKPRIVKELFDFLSRVEVRARIRSLLDHRDLQMLSAVSLLGQPLLSDLLDFLGLETHALEIHHHLLNLEERLLLYRRKEKTSVRIILTPLLLEPDFDGLLDQRLLFPSEPAEGTLAIQPPWFTDIFAVALGAVVQEKTAWFSPAGEIKKRHLPDILKRFPQLGSIEIELGLKTMLRLGLLIPGEVQLTFNSSFWDDISRLNSRSRLALFWTTAGVEDPAVASDWSRHFWRMVEGWPVGRSLDFETLERWLGLTVGSPGNQGLIHWLETLKTIRVLIPNSKGLLELNPRLEEKESTTFKILPTQEIHLSPGTDLKTALGALKGAWLKSWDVVTVFEVSKASVVSSLSRGETSTSLAHRWEELQGSPLERNLLFHLAEWEKEFYLLRFYRGVVMTVHSSAISLVESAPSFAAQVLRTLAPGVYLVKEEGFEAWRQELHRRGLPLGADPVDDNVRPVSWGRPWSFNGWSLEDAASPWPGGTGGAHETDKTFLDTMKAKVSTFDWTEESRQEALARIQRRLVLEEKQLSRPWGRMERSEARGLDFAGKLRIADQAVASSHDLLEIQQRDGDGQPASFLVLPKTMERIGKDFLLKGETVDTHQPFTGYVGKMSLVRRIRVSLF